MNEIVVVKNKYLRLKKPFANLVPGEFVYCFSENENEYWIALPKLWCGINQVRVNKNLLLEIIEYP